MHYAILLQFPYVFYDSEPQSNALLEICIMTLCTMRISTVLPVCGSNTGHIDTVDDLLRHELESLTRPVIQAVFLRCGFVPS
jgi:hypothetical protein